MSRRHLWKYSGDPRCEDLLQVVRADLHLHRLSGCGRLVTRCSGPPPLCSVRGGGQLDLWKVRPPSPRTVLLFYCQVSLLHMALCGRLDLHLQHPPPGHHQHGQIHSRHPPRHLPQHHDWKEVLYNLFISLLNII